MTVFLWILQGLLAVVFLAAGLAKITQPLAKLEPNMPWVYDFPAPVVRLIGIVEVAGALGLILPAATGVAVILTPLAAAGLALTMLLAALVHARRKEFGGQTIGLNVLLLLLAAIVAWGRFGPYAF